MHTIISIYVLIFIVFENVSLICSGKHPEFCDENYIDAVLWDGFTYSVTRDKWIATYDQNTKTVGEFVAQNIHLLYQSKYHIKDVPKCSDTSNNNCVEMNRLEGLTVNLLIDSKGEQFYTIELKNKSLELPYDLKERFIMDSSQFWPKDYNERKQRYRPAVYSPKDCFFLYIVKGKASDKNLFFSNKLNSEMTIGFGENWQSFEDLDNMKVITIFWWDSQSKLYLVCEPLNGLRNATLLQVIFTTTPSNRYSIEFQKTGLTVYSFFGCDKQTTSSPNNPNPQNTSPKTTTSTTTTTQSPGDQTIAIILKIIVIIIEIVVIVILLFVVCFLCKEEPKDSTKTANKTKTSSTEQSIHTESETL